MTIFSLSKLGTKLKAAFGNPHNRWKRAQTGEAQYWEQTDPYFLPWTARFERFDIDVPVTTYEVGADVVPLNELLVHIPVIKDANLPEPLAVADFGSGPSGIGYALQHTGDTYCIDPLLDTYKKIAAYRQNVFSKLADKTHCLCEPAETVVLPKPVDLAFCINVLDHTRNAHDVLSNISRHLKIGGFLVLFVDGYLNRKPYIIDELHPHHFIQSDLQQMFDQNGFDVVLFKSQPYVHGGRLCRYLVALQNIGHSSKIEFCEFFAICLKRENTQAR